MTIDNPQEVKSLIKKMEAILPIPVRGTPELLKTLANQGDKYKPDHEFLIEKILYAGDEGGIGYTPDKVVHRIWGKMEKN